MRLSQGQSYSNPSAPRNAEHRTPNAERLQFGVRRWALGLWRLDLLLPRVAPHELRLPDHVAFHGGIEFLAACSRLEIQLLIEREDFEKVAVRSGRRTRAAIARLSKTTSAFDSRRRTTFGDRFGLRINVPHQPVREQPTRRVGIIHDQRQRFRFRWHTFDFQWRTCIGPVTGEFPRNVSAFGKR